MSTDIKVPTLGESVTEATIGQWFKKVGDSVNADEPVVELETDKVTIEVPAPAAGVLEAISANPGDTVNVGALIGAIGQGNGQSAGSSDQNGTQPTPAAKTQPVPQGSNNQLPPLAGQYSTSFAVNGQPGVSPSNGSNGSGNGSMPASPSAQRLMTENRMSNSDVEGSGRRGQILKEDVLAALARPPQVSVPVPPAPSAEAPRTPEPARAPEAPRAPEPAQARAPEPTRAPSRGPVAVQDDAREERVKMSRLRQTIARRLKDAQNTAAMLTTFNEVDMKPVMDLRATYKELFEKKHGVKLGFMGFFTKAVTHALKELPAVNAEIDGDDLVYKNYAHVGIAVGTDKGLVVPVVRDADQKSIAEIEKEIGRLGKLARDGQLTMADMQGGTFTITNGGVYGSLMSTPILNAPQSGILGMHKIQERPVVVGGQIVIRPMMYLALSYDHRIVDGKEAVTFLVRIKESLEAPERLVLDL
jgi:2-oxoglutarate dehydrogenase E2 component (dihydrolipoamide succinyltransferase)